MLLDSQKYRIKSLLFNFWNLTVEVLTNQRGNGPHYINHGIVLTLGEDDLLCHYCKTNLELIFKEVEYEVRHPRPVPKGAKDLKLVDIRTWAEKYKFANCPHCKAKYGRGSGLEPPKVPGPDGNYVWRALDLIPDDKTLGDILISFFKSRDSESTLPKPDYKILKVITTTLDDYDVEGNTSSLHLYLKGKGPKKEEDTKCFIATTVYGSYSPEVKILRKYRDEHLLKSTYGKALIFIYYLISPQIACFIQMNKTARFLTKVIILKPIFLLAKVQLSRSLK